jgi:hypothetical protein
VTQAKLVSRNVRAVGKFGRNPIILVAALLFLLLFIVLPLINRKKSNSGFSAKDRGLRTFDALHFLDKAQQDYAKAHGGKYTSQIADLIATSPRLRDDLALTPIVVQTLSATDNGYYVQLTSDIVSLAETRIGTKKVLNCVIIKKTSGVSCPGGSITQTGTVAFSTAPITTG